MPIPLILAGAAIAAGAYGVKKGIDAKGDFDAAKAVNEESEATIKKADNILEEARIKTQSKLEDYGARKIEAISESLNGWKQQFDKFKNVDLDRVRSEEFGDIQVDQTMLSLKEMQVTLGELGLGGGAAASSGAIAGFAAYGGVQLLGAASTGTAISGLSGAAATNATLAWLGGGSLAANGFGMAGGAAVLGGVVAGPILAVGGLLLASKAEEAFETALANKGKAESYMKQKKAATAATQQIYWAAFNLDNLLGKLTDILGELTSQLKFIVSREQDYRQLDDAEKSVLANSALLAKLIVGVIECPVLDENGVASQKGKELIRATNDHLARLGEI